MKKIALSCLHFAIAWVTMAGAGCGVMPPPMPGVDNVPASFVLPNGEAQTAFLLQGGYIIVDVAVNGAGPYPFLLDTGASVSIVSPKIARALPQNILGTTSIVSTGDSNSIRADFILVDQFQMGPVAFERLQAAILPELSITAGGRTIITEGILGAPLFRNLLLTVDYPGRIVRIRQTGDPDTDNCAVLPIQSGPDELPTLALKVAGRDIVALIDTGNNEFLVLPTADGDLPFSGPTQPGFAVTVTGRVDIIRGTLNGSVQSGCVSFDKPIVTIGGNLATMGARAFLDYSITLDQPSSRFWFQSVMP